MTRSVLVLAWSLLAILVACDDDKDETTQSVASKENPASKSGEASSGAPGAEIVASLGTWNDEPSGAAWEALAWIPERAATQIIVADYGVVRKIWEKRFRSPDFGENPVKSLTSFVFHLNLPGIAVGQCVAWVNVPEKYSGKLCELSLPPEEIGANLKLLGFSRDTRSPAGAEIWMRGGHEYVGLFQGRLLHCGSELPEVALECILGAIRARTGEEPSLQSRPEVRRILAALPADFPLSLECPPKPEAILGSDTLMMEARATAWEPGSWVEVDVVSFVSDAGPGEALPLKAARWETQGWKFARASVKGRTLRVEGYLSRDDEARHEVNHWLKSLAYSLDEYRAREGRYPETQAWPAALGKVKPYGWSPEDETFDPWGTPFIYRFPHPADPERFDLRSAGPDRKPDTMDDIPAR